MAGKQADEATRLVVGRGEGKEEMGKKRRAAGRKGRGLQDLARPLLDLLAWSAWYSTCRGFACGTVMRWLVGVALFFH
jgi:hypothetical protein